MEPVTRSATGVSDVINLPPGKYKLQVRGTGTFTVDIQEGTPLADMYYDSTTKVTISNTGTPQSVIVDGGPFAMNVTALEAAKTVTLSAERVGT